MDVLKRLFSFKGRARRREFLLTLLFSVVLTMTVYLVMFLSNYSYFEDKLKELFDFVRFMQPVLLSDHIFLVSESIFLEVEFVFWAATIVLIPVFILCVPVCIRRLHDAGKSGKFLLIYWAITTVVSLLAPLFGFISLIVEVIVDIHFFFQMIEDSDRGINKYGNSPKYPETNPAVLAKHGYIVSEEEQEEKEAFVNQNEVSESKTSFTEKTEENSEKISGKIETLKNKISEKPKIRKIIIISSCGLVLLVGAFILIKKISENMDSSYFEPSYSAKNNSKEEDLPKVLEDFSSFTENTMGLEIVKIIGGTFQMGNRNGMKDEQNVHSVTVSSFRMSATEVTQSVYEKIMEKNPSSPKNPDYPVNNVTFEDALIFCNKFSLRNNLKPCYSVNGDTNPDSWQKGISKIVSCDFSANGFRLPTEAEWEYGAAEGNETAFFTHSGSNSYSDVGFFDKKPHKVAQKWQNSLGLYDMSGNVLEWCWDWYEKDYPLGAQTNPIGPESGTDRILRGGSFKNPDERNSVTFRSYEEPHIPHNFVGFRVVRK